MTHSLEVSSIGEIIGIKLSERLKNSVYSMNSTVSGGISGSIYQIEQALKKENSLVSEFQYDFVEMKDKISRTAIIAKGQ